MTFLYQKLSENFDNSSTRCYLLSVVDPNIVRGIQIHGGVRTELYTTVFHRVIAEKPTVDGVFTYDQLKTGQCPADR